MTIFEVQAALEAVAPCYVDVLPQAQDTGITVSLALTLGAEHESGSMQAEQSTFMVRVFSRAYRAADQAVVDSAVTALRNAGLYITNRGPLIRAENAQYWQYNITATSWEAL